jgi:hypothetical protein
MLFFCFFYSTTLKMEAIWFFEVWVEFRQTTQSYIPEYITLQKLQNEDFINYIFPLPNVTVISKGVSTRSCTNIIVTIYGRD